MKNYITIILIFFSFTINGISQNCSSIILDTKNDSVFFENKPYTGDYYEYYPGLLKLEGQFFNGIKEGTFTEYIDEFDRNIFTLTNYKNGKKNGTKDFILYNKPCVSEYFINDTLNGKSYYWNSESGFLDSIIEYRNGSLIEKKDYSISNKNVKALIIASSDRAQTTNVHTQILLNKELLCKNEKISFFIYELIIKNQDTILNKRNDYEIISIEFGGPVYTLPNGIYHIDMYYENIVNSNILKKEIYERFLAYHSFNVKITIKHIDSGKIWYLRKKILFDDLNYKCK